MTTTATLKAFSGALSGVKKADLNLATTLFGGMSFRWRLHGEGKFLGVIGHRVYILRQNESEDRIEFTSYSAQEQDDAQGGSQYKEPAEELRDYFRLNEDLNDLCQYWSKRDAKFRDRVETYPDVLLGIRVLRLHPVENLFSFICSSNNNIKRITQMVSNMCVHFGRKIGSIDGSGTDQHYAFPSISRLAESDVEEKLRKLSFGYRAKFIHQAAVHLAKTSPTCEDWLFSLRTQPYEHVHQELTKIPGIGKKVADCICLMSMDKLEAIPVDTHVLSLARTLYNFDKSSPKAGQAKTNNNLTDKSYWEIAGKFRDLWGKYAGWAQTIMFVDDLKSFQKVKSESLLTSLSPKKLIKNEPEAPEAVASESSPPKAELKSEPVAVKEELKDLKSAKTATAAATKRAGTDSAPNTPTKIKPSKSKRRKH